MDWNFLELHKASMQIAQVDSVLQGFLQQKAAEFKAMQKENETLKEELKKLKEENDRLKKDSDKTT